MLSWFSIFIILILPFLSTSKKNPAFSLKIFCLLSTPKQKKGFFYEWQHTKYPPNFFSFQRWLPELITIKYKLLLSHLCISITSLLLHYTLKTMSLAISKNLKICLCINCFSKMKLTILWCSDQLVKYSNLCLQISQLILLISLLRVLKNFKISILSYYISWDI